MEYKFVGCLHNIIIKKQNKLLLKLSKTKLQFAFILQLLCNYNNFNMFPSVIKEDTLKQKIKEKQWDERFGIRTGIPDYSPLKDKHTKSYRKNITNKKQQNESEVKPKKLTTYFQKRLQLVEQLYQLHKPNKSLIQEYEEIARKYKIPNFYIYYNLLPLLSPSVNITQYLFKQKKQTKEQASNFHKMSIAVKARQECLQRLRKTLAQLQQGDIQKSRIELRQQVQHLRMLTANVIDQIKKWRDALGKIDERPVYYTDSLENYLVKILNDNKFIFSSKLSGALAFGQKNDPFLLVPVKKAEGKQSSLFTEIVKLNKDISHYQKYMEYLASQKAYDLAINAAHKQPQTYKNPIVQKIYKPLASKLGQPFLNKQGQQDDIYKKMQVFKAREDRLKKNDQRIKSIKSIYQTFGRKDQKNQKHYVSQRKMPETDTEDKRGLKKRSQSIKMKRMDASDVQFQFLVKAKLEAQKSEKQQKRKAIKISHSKSASKFHKNEEKMIESLRDIQSTLRNKLQVIQQDQKNEVANNSLLSATQQKFSRKNNEDIIKQLKAQILNKIEKETAEKQKLKKLKREQDQKALQQIKQKLKKEMEQKLQQKKREKMLQRQELQKKLKEEQERLNNQRQLELQLQIKLTKQKQLRELQKIKREALQREKKFKEELEKQQLLRRQKQQAIENQRRQKQRLMEQLRKKQLKQQIEDQLRKQMKTTNIKEKSIEISQKEIIKNQKQAELAKQIELLKIKEGVEMQQLKRENQLRQRMLKLKKEQEELKRKEIQHLMRSVVQQQKQQLEQDTIKQRIQLQERMRSNIKQKLLQEYKNQKQARIEKIKNQREAQLQQEVYRQKIREKIQKQMRMEAIQRTKKELQERQSKKYEIRTKLQAVKNKFDKEVVFDKQKIQQDVKKQMIEKVIFDKQAEKEAAKYDLRLQFQKELMASAIPQIYQNKDSFLVKNINYFEGDLHLNSKISQLKPTNQKPINDSPKKKLQKGQIKQMKDSMTLQQLQVYEKQKQKVSEIKEQKVIVEAKLPYEEEGFQKLNIVKDKKQQEGYEVKIMKMKQVSKNQSKKLEKYKNKKKKQKKSSSQIDSEDEVKKKKQAKKNKRRYYQQEASQDSQDVPKKKKIKEKKRKSTSSQASQSQERSPLKNVKRQIQFRQVERSQKKSKINPNKQPQKVIQKESSQKAVVHFDSENKIALSQIEPVTIKPQKVSNTTQKYKISLEAIPEAEFDQYLSVHLSSVTPLQLIIQMNNREDLYRKLIGQLTFCLLVAQLEGRVIGQALAYHDRTRSDLRKFNIIHLGTYKDQFLQDFVLSLTNYIFRKDPCDQIQFLFKFNEANSDQLSFSQNFNKWFDKFGSVFQKKIDDNNYERKYVLKRQFNQKCQVVLGGINKNTFRNLFSVYCGVLMSDTDMLQFKQQLIDTLAPENQICYSLMVSELFRTYLSPDEAELLKNKVKEFVKLKQMLILVVSMQKKKLRLQELKLYEYKNLIELNMRLMSQGKQIIRYCKDSASQLNRIYYAELNHAFNLPFHFQTTSLPVEANSQGQIRQISYFRLSPLPPFKLHIIKSSLYNAEMNILPTQNSKYKIFVLSAQEYNQIRQSNNIDLFMYIRLFLKNVKSHNVAVWKYVWLPQMTDKGAWNLREFKNFLNKDFYTHDTINISYRQFLPGALIIEPQHRDLVLTPPFIVGVMSMNLQQVSEGSPLYARMIEVNALKTLEIQK